MSLVDGGPYYLKTEKAKQTPRELGTAKQHSKEMKINICFSKKHFLLKLRNRWRGCF